MKYEITVRTLLGDTYRTNRVRSLFNVSLEQAAEHVISVDVPHEAKPWRVGAIIGPSGTGKTTLGRQLLGDAAYLRGYDWPSDQPIVDAMGTELSFDEVTGALSSVGLGTVPSWLRPFHVLSGGERFRAELARALLDTTGDIVLDEFTSVVDRQVAQVGANAFGKAWRRSPPAGPSCSPATTTSLTGCSPTGSSTPEHGRSSGGRFNVDPTSSSTFGRRTGAHGRHLRSIIT